MICILLQDLVFPRLSVFFPRFTTSPPPGFWPQPCRIRYPRYDQGVPFDPAQQQQDPYEYEEWVTFHPPYNAGFVNYGGWLIYMILISMCVYAIEISELCRYWMFFSAIDRESKNYGLLRGLFIEILVANVLEHGTTSFSSNFCSYK